MPPQGMPHPDPAASDGFVLYLENSIDRAAASGNVAARDLVSYFVGQGVGLIDSVKSAGAVVQEFKEDFADAIEHMNALVEE